MRTPEDEALITEKNAMIEYLQTRVLTLGIAVQNLSRELELKNQNEGQHESLSELQPVPES